MKKQGKPKKQFKPTPTTSNRKHFSAGKPQNKNFQYRPQRPAPGGTMNPREGRIVAGVHAVVEVLKVRPHAVTKLWLKNGVDLKAEPFSGISQLIKKTNVEVQFKSGQQLDQICNSHQGIAAQVTETPKFTGIQENACYVILDQIEDPHNLGAMLRTGWLLGVDAFFIPEHHSVGLTPTVHKVATGACEHVPVTSISSIKRLIADLKDKEFQVIGLSGEAKETLFRTQFPKSIAFVIGSESDGLRKTTEESCDKLLAINQTTSQASFNASVACAMVLSEWKRQTSFAM